MNITKSKLKQIIAEEYQRFDEQDDMGVPAMPGQEEPAISQGEELPNSASKLKIALKNLAMDTSKFKGIDPKEAAAIADAINRLLGKAQEGSAGAIFKRLSVAFERLKI